MRAMSILIYSTNFLLLIFHILQRSRSLITNFRNQSANYFSMREKLLQSHLHDAAIFIRKNLCACNFLFCYCETFVTRYSSRMKENT